jgi:hypothetical protein
MTLVILDTSAIIASSREFKSPAFESFLANGRRLGYTLALPKVVIEELVNRFRRDAEKLHERANSAIAEFESMSGFELPPVFDEELVRLAVHSYEQRIRVVLNAANTEI